MFWNMWCSFIIQKVYNNVSSKIKKNKKDIATEIRTAISNCERMTNPEVFEEVSDYGQKSQTTTKTLHVPIDEPETSVSSQPKTVPAKRKKRGTLVIKSKGKAKKAKIMWPCGICGNNCVDQSVACDGCDTWYHFICIHVDEDELPDEWFCNSCNNNKD